MAVSFAGAALERGLGRWEPDAALARKQFDFYSEDLARGIRLPSDNEAEAVDRARRT